MGNVNVAQEEIALNKNFGKYVLGVIPVVSCPLNYVKNNAND